MDDTILDGDHPDENRRLLRKQRKRREERRKRKRRKRGIKKDKKKKKKKKKGRGGLCGFTVDFCCCEFICVMIPILLGLVLLAAAIFVIVIDKIVYTKWKKPEGDCLVVQTDPVKVSYEYKGEFNSMKNIRNGYYMELNLTVGNIVPCVVNGGSSAYDSDPLFVDLLAFVILALVISVYILYFPFIMITIFRCVVRHFIVRYCFKGVLVIANCAWLIFWFVFFFLFCFGVAHIVIRSIQWINVNKALKTYVPYSCNVTDVDCNYVYANIKVQYLANGTVTPSSLELTTPFNNKSKNGTHHKNSTHIPLQLYATEIVDPLPTMCWRKGNIIPCLVKPDDPKAVMLYYRVPPSSWFWWIFGVTSGVALLLSIVACYGGCFLFPGFIIEGLICSAQLSAGGKRRKYSSLDDEDDYVDRRIFKL